jgi:hypothetical protein
MYFEIDQKLAYETGVHIGDGNLYSKNRTHKITYSGNLLNEESYYLDILKPLLEEIFGIEPAIIRWTKRNAILLVLNSKMVANFKINVLGLPNGKKTHSTIPERIKEDPPLLRECLKGIGDTDLSPSFKKTRSGKYSEPRMDLFTRSTELANQLQEILHSMQFTVSKKKKIRRGFLENRVRMHGKRNLELWLKTIGFLNPYRLSKIAVWRKIGEVYPHLLYHDYLSLLDSH